MEFRYVYRRVEDAIGAPLNIKDSPHAVLTRRLRYDLREARDIGRRRELAALGLASLGGNDSLDAVKLSARVMDLLDQAFGQSLPYVRPSIPEPAPLEENKTYDDYFRELDELDRQTEKGKYAKDAKDAKPDGAK